MISRKLVAHFLSRSFFSASPEFVCQNCQKCQTTRGGEKERQKRQFFALSGEGVPVPCPVSAAGSPEFVCQKLSKVSSDPGGEKERQKRQFCSLWGGCSSSMSCVGYRQPGICLSKLSKVSSDPGGEKERQKRQFCSLQFHVLCPATGSPEFVCQNCQKCQTTRGAKKSVKSVTFALSGEGVPVPCSVSATGSPEFVCENCQKCQNDLGAKKGVKSVNFALSGEGVPVPCSVSATGLVSRHGSEFDISQACRFCNVRAGAQAISGAQKCLQRASKRF